MYSKSRAMANTKVLWCENAPDQESGTLLVRDQDYWNTDDWKLEIYK
jgi:hypothetical protein